jgi:hypothetical protein
MAAVASETCACVGSSFPVKRLLLAGRRKGYFLYYRVHPGLGPHTPAFRKARAVAFQGPRIEFANGRGIKLILLQNHMI